MPDQDTPEKSAQTPLQAKPAIAGTELIVFVAMANALGALSVDIMLPALATIQAEFGLANDNDRQWVILSYLAALGMGQLFHGPLSDAFGRRASFFLAMLVFLAGSVLCVVAPSFEILIAARLLQGFGGAAARVFSVALVRDMTSGARMAQVMSFAMTIFMIVPIVAPGLGQLLLIVAPWRALFWALFAHGLILMIWAAFRIPETLPRERRRAFSLKSIAGGYARVLAERNTLGYMLASAFMSGALFGYVAVSERIYLDYFDLGALFPFAFATVAITVSIGSSINARLVVRLGMRRIAHTMLIWFMIAAFLHGALNALGLNALWAFLPMLGLTFGVFGLILGNFNALAMEPLGDIAGTGSALYGAVSATGGALLGNLLAGSFTTTLSPFLLGMGVFAAAALACVFVTERGKLFQDPPGALPTIIMRKDHKR